MNKKEITDQWSAAVDANTFLTPKHDPAVLSFSWDRFRTVLSAEAAANLSGFIKSGEYSICAYDDTRYPGTSGIFEIIPSGVAPFSVAGSGVPPASITPSGAYDRLVVAYAKKKWMACLCRELRPDRKGYCQGETDAQLPIVGPPPFVHFHTFAS